MNYQVIEKFQWFDGDKYKVVFQSNFYILAVWHLLNETRSLHFSYFIHQRSEYVVYHKIGTKIKMRFKTFCWFKLKWFLLSQYFKNYNELIVVKRMHNFSKLDSPDNACKAE